MESASAEPWTYSRRRRSSSEDARRRSARAFAARRDGSSSVRARRRRGGSASPPLPMSDQEMSRLAARALRSRGVREVAARAPSDGTHEEAELALDERPVGILVEATRVRPGVGAMADVADDLRQRIRLGHELLVLVDGARTQRAAHLREEEGEGVVTGGRHERVGAQSSSSSRGRDAHLVHLRRVESLDDDGPKQRLHLTQLVRGHRPVV